MWIIVMFWLSFWRHPFAAEDPLVMYVSKWCDAALQKNIKNTVQMKKLYILDGFRVSTFSANFQFGVNCSFKIFGEKHLYF